MPVATGKMPMPSLDMLTPRQSKAARVLLGFGQEELAKRARVAPRTVMDFESGAREAQPSTKVAIAHALMASGVDLLEGQGVALRAA
jgi:transcriptional regulator with XRE-family HTH domain